MQERRDERRVVAVRNRVGKARAVVLIEVAKILIRTADSDVVREEPVGRRAPGFDSRVVIERRRADSQAADGVTRVGSGLDDLIDEAAQSRRVRVRLAAAGVDLELLLPKRAFGVSGEVVERAIDRHAVVFEADLVVIAAANVDALIDADLVGRNVSAGHRGDRGVSVVETAAAAERRGRRGQRGIDRINIGSGSRTHRTQRRSRANAGDFSDAFLQANRQRLALIGEDRDAGEHVGFVAAVLGRDRVRVGRERQEGEASRRIGRNVGDLRRT